jgi:transcription elongation GreA/GreB family factor
MEKKEIVSFLYLEIEKTRQRLAELAKKKASADGPRTSWHSTIHIDIEIQIEGYGHYQKRCLEVLAALENRQPFSIERVCKGSIILLDIEGEIRSYIVVDDGGAAIGDYLIISRQSPIGKAIWGKRVGERAEVSTPQDPIPVKILELN